MQNIAVVSPTTALISRIAEPLLRAKGQVDAFVDELHYGRPRPAQLAFIAPICGAGNNPQLIRREVMDCLRSV